MMQNPRKQTVRQGSERSRSPSIRVSFIQPANACDRKTVVRDTLRSSANAPTPMIGITNLITQHNSRPRPTPSNRCYASPAALRRPKNKRTPTGKTQEIGLERTNNDRTKKKKARNRGFFLWFKIDNRKSTLLNSIHME